MLQIDWMVLGANMEVSGKLARCLPLLRGITDLTGISEDVSGSTELL